ncbi:hypothetical protein KIN20_003137 [Parelaphostrongylus tenuis]|uniref:Uncharacterized protein n=1 Tax=Parelaphostrongylus tenuis TaxID=148309 RepID=A0AAD5QH81_PARTN|nr:hypothetical protein KIN20_003137 [Parelaphostrongylus tenuis]
MDRKFGRYDNCREADTGNCHLVAKGATFAIDTCRRVIHCLQRKSKTLLCICR